MPKPRDYIVLGSLLSIVSRRECGLCSLVAGIVTFDTGIDLPPNMPDDERKEKQRARLIGLMEEVYYLCPIRFKTTYRTPSLYVCSGTEVAQMSRQSSVVRPRRSMAIRPIHRSEGNLGRLLMKPDQIDFDWIRERIELCDERDEGKLDYEHTVQLRVIDVDRLCIVDLEDSVRYVTLSYTWGKAKQVRLLRNNEAFFRTGGLGKIYNELPKTIADSIQLVREIGERYLWVDALCILQDDDEDKKTQIGAMGDIYRNSILTICACCGEDANYGLPGMEPGTRKTRQVAEVVGDFIVGNAMADSEAMEGAKWDSRGWTLQEKVLSQRKLYISDTYALWWCWHTITAEDENCRHRWWQPGTRHRGMYFYKSEHDLIVSKMRKSSNMDIYAFIITDYTARDLTSQLDAEHAVTGAMNAIVGLFRREFVQGLPDTELSAALLWVPLGSSTRRVHPQKGEPLFPSWSWLGWVGHAAYPWLIERALPMSEDGSPLLWKNLRADAEEEEKWFTGEMYRMDGLRPNLFEHLRGQPRRWSVDDDGGWAWIDQHSESHRWLHPVEDRYEGRFSFFDESSRRLCFRTLSAQFTLDDRVQTRKENYDYLHTVRIMRLLNVRGFSAGYIYVPDISEMSSLAKAKFSGDTPREFIVLSRSSTNPDPRIGEELLYTTPIAELHSVYSMSYMLGAMERLRPVDGEGGEGVESELDEMAYFDTRLYDATMPWGLFDVLMVERQNGVAYRVVVGRIHVAAFMEGEPVEQEIVLE
jgi:Heterokaryon incompatibility protein (HET)